MVEANILRYQQIEAMGPGSSNPTAASLIEYSLTKVIFVHKIASMSRNASKSSSTSDQARPRYSVPALEKGLAIIEFLAGEDLGHSQTEIAKRLGRSQSEIFRMLTCLEQRGYIQRGPGDERYRLTSKLFELAHTHPPTAKLIDLAIPVMRRFAEQANQSCHLVVHQSHRAVVIAQVDSPEFVGISVRPGRALVLHKTVSGRVLVAFQPTDIQTMWLESLQAKLSTECYEELASRLEQIRSQGHDTCPSTVVDGVLDLSAPVLNLRGEAAAALSVPCIVRSQEEAIVRRTLKLLHRAADEISQAIGYNTPLSRDA